MNEKEAKAINTGRQLRLVGGALMPLLEKKREVAVQTLIGDYRNGGRNLMIKVAELAVLQNLIDELKRTEQNTTRLEEKHHGTK